METYEKNIKEALNKLPEEYKALVERRGDLQVQINNAREWRTIPLNCVNKCERLTKRLKIIKINKECVTFSEVAQSN